MEINLYEELNRESVQRLMSYTDWLSRDETFTINICCGGGQILASWGIAAKLKQAKARGCTLKANIHGLCASMMTAILPFFDEVNALDLATDTIMIHRGAYPETDDDGNEIEVTPEMQKRLDGDNIDIFNALASRVDSAKLKALKGYTLADLFDSKKPRVDCWLTAKEAQEIGLVNKLISMDAGATKTYQYAVATASIKSLKATAATAVTKTPITMDLATLKANHPEVYAQAVAEAKQGMKTEDDPCAGCTKKTKAQDKGAEATTEATTEATVMAVLSKLGLSALTTTAAGSPAAVNSAAVLEAEAKKQAEAVAAAKVKETEAVSEVEKELKEILK